MRAPHPPKKLSSRSRCAFVGKDALTPASFDYSPLQSASAPRRRACRPPLTALFTQPSPGALLCGTCWARFAGLDRASFAPREPNHTLTLRFLSDVIMQPIWHGRRCPCVRGSNDPGKQRSRPVTLYVDLTRNKDAFNLSFPDSPSFIRRQPTSWRTVWQTRCTTLLAASASVPCRANKP